VNKTFVRWSVGAEVSDFDIRISNFSTFGTPKAGSKSCLKVLTIKNQFVRKLIMSQFGESPAKSKIFRAGTGERAL
jgi:hypothetical protein